MKASPQEQLRLLELAALDAELGRLEHRRRGLPEHAEVERLDARAAELHDGIVTAETEVGDLTREQNKAEGDVEQVRARVDRDRKRLDAGQVSSPRELENLQSEIGSLHRRQSDLEEIVLDVMERLEAVDNRLASLSAEQARLGGERADAAARRGAALTDIAARAGELGERRAGIAERVPADVLGLYEKLRDQHGVGAAALRRGRCEGCHLALGTVDLNRIRAADPDEVLRCEECRRILVRTPESGL
ncbi:MAG TPA: C4-type zinc ribbon domain-containing protein [Streptosporangiaceae bacterium]|nr:C4-type zinc ribbon domain-containing protein [Streptosporangiaceae bacterium]